MTPRQCKAIFLRKVDPIGFLLNSRQNIGTGNLCVQKRYLRHWSLALSLVLLLLADSSLAIISSKFPKTQQPTVGSSLKLIGLRYPGLEMLHVSCSMETLSCSLFFLKFSYKVTNRLFAIFFYDGRSRIYILLGMAIHENLKSQKASFWNVVANFKVLAQAKPLFGAKHR